jgi:hypothetical protein
MNPVGEDPAVVDQKPGGGQHDAAAGEEVRESSAFSSSSPSPSSFPPLPSPRRGRPHGQQQRQHQLQEPWMEAAEAFSSSSNTPHRSGGGLFPVRVSRRSILGSLSTAPSALTLP